MNMNVTINADSTVSIGGTITGYCVRQDSDGTQVVGWHNNGYPRPLDLGDQVKLPKARYALSSPADRAEFDEALLAAWAVAKATQC